MPIVYQQLGEAQEGQIDAVLEPPIGAALNYTRVAAALDAADIRRHAPRLATTAYVVANCVDEAQARSSVCWSTPTSSSPQRCEWLYCRADRRSGCLASSCPTTPVAQVDLVLVDGVAEDAAGIGAGWPSSVTTAATGGGSGGGGGGSGSSNSSLTSRVLKPPAAIKPGTLVLSVAAAESAGLTSLPAIVFVGIDVAALLGAAWSAVDNRTALAARRAPGTFAYVPFLVERLMLTSGGKLGAAATDFGFLDLDSFVASTAPHMHPFMTPSAHAAFAALELKHVVSEVLVNLPADVRRRAYLDPNTDRVTSSITSFIGDAVFAANFASLHSRTPVLSVVANSWAISMVLGLLLDVVAAVLVLLSVALIYALLAVNVETRRFETAVLRLLGASQRVIATTLAGNAASYALPALVVGLVVSQLVMFFVAALLTLLSGQPTDAGLAGRGVVEAVLLALAIPTVASVAPVRRALAQTVSAGLRATSVTASATKIELARNDGGGVNVPLLVGGVLGTAFGFVVYYALPLAMLSLDIELLLDLFVSLIVGMLIGLTVLAINATYLLQRALAYVVAAADSGGVRSLLRANLVANRGRNRKTAIVFALSVAFVVFLDASENIQTAEYTFRQRQHAGSTLGVWTTDADRLSPSMRSALEAVVLSTAGVEDAAWSSEALQTYGTGECALTTLGDALSKSVTVHAISPNLFQVADADFLLPASATTAGRALYRPPASAAAAARPPIIIGRALADAFGVDVGDELVLVLPRGRGGRRCRVRVAYVLTAAPAFAFSRFPSSRRHDVLLAFDAFAALDADSPTAASVDGVRLDRLMLRVREPHTSVGETADSLLDSVREDLATHAALLTAPVSVHDVRPGLRRLKQITAITSTFFSGATALALVISAFALVSSSYVNVHESRAQLGVLRAVGANRAMVFRAYAYEAFLVVVSAQILGVVVGSAVAYMVVSQQVVFTQLPLAFAFPWTLGVILLSGGVVLSLIATALPLWPLLSAQPTAVLRSAR